MDGLICLQRETHRFAEEWERTRDPRAEGLSALIAIETLRTLALVTMAELGKRAGAGADGGPRPPRARAPPHRKRRQAPYRARADDGRCRRARRTGRARGQYDACRTGRNRPPGSRGARLPWAHRLANGQSGWIEAPLADSHVTPPPPASESTAIAQDATTPAGRMWGTRAIHGTRTGRGMPS